MRLLEELIYGTKALADDRHKVLFLTLSTRCASVVCCRVSPMQKALVTKLVREALGVMTLAIGDGANDVSMIQVSTLPNLNAYAVLTKVR